MQQQQRAMPTDRDELRLAVRRTLALRAGHHPDARGVTQALLSIWQHIAVRLAPVVGDRGVQALFGRALHLTGSRYPWLTVEHQELSLGTLRTRLEAREVGSAYAASQALLETFGELLGSLVGEPLTARLLAPVWAPSTPLEGT